MPPYSYRKATMGSVLIARRARMYGIEGIAFGDLLEDGRCHWEKRMKGTGLEPIFPVWGLPTRELAQEMIASGVRAKLTCIDTRKLDQSFAGREFDQVFLSALPDGADPCGERGEFHSVVYAGPMLNPAIPVSVGATVIQDHFAFADLIS
jgi:diphthamide synthase (EF-2-diphthine--ammonia ligase)